MLLYGVVIALIGLVCASIVTWPVMLCIALCLAGTILTLGVMDGGSLVDASLKAFATLTIVEGAYVVGGFAVSLVRRRRLLGEKRHT